MWCSILSGNTESEARESIREISAELQAMDLSTLPSIRLCEHALLYAYLGLDTNTSDWHDKSLLYLNLAIERLSVAPLIQLGLYGGLAGFGWMAQHVVSILTGDEDGSPQEDGDEDDVLLELDKRLLNLLKDDDQLGLNYDLIGGYVGVGIYWLERLPRKTALMGIQQTLAALERLSTITPLGITWFTPAFLVPPSQIDKAPSGYYNLGVAHGVPGVIGFLAQVVAYGFGDEITNKASALLAGAMEWLLAQQRPPDSISRYSAWAIPGQDCGDSRTAWCYGDLGIASVLRLVAQRTHNPFWMIGSRNLIDRCI